MSDPERRRTRRLGDLFDGAIGRGADDVEVAGIATDAGRVTPGDLFVALRGDQRDGHTFIGDAVARGAAAVVTERPLEEASVPVIRVSNGRRALADLAAEWYGRPGERIPLVGITGSLGKTSVLTMLRAILAAADREVAIVGSLGAHVEGYSERTRLTTPEPVTLHRLLAAMVGHGADLTAMEVTSHALVQERVHGLCYTLGVFTNLVMLEHQAYHGSFREYVDAKTRFFDYLPPGAPVVYAAGDRLVSALVEARDLTPVGCGAGGRPFVRIERRTLDADGTHLQLTVRRALPRIDGGCVHPVVFPLDLRLLGRPNVNNAAIAATTALCLGAPVTAVQDALAAFPAPRRRMEIVHRGRFTVLDDTVGHPDSISGVFEVAERLAYARLHAVYAIRGQRGAEINRRDAEALAIWVRRLKPDRVIVTSAVEAADAANQVEPEERNAFTGMLRRYDVSARYRARLEDAVVEGLEGAGAGDLVLLLGAQGMNAGAEIVADWLGRRSVGDAR